MANNKIIYGGKVLIDLTSDTASADKVLEGFTFHDKTGENITGTCTFDSNTQDANATGDDILEGKTAYARKSKITGTIPNKGGAGGEILTMADGFTIPRGFYDGSGKVEIAASEKIKIVSKNIRQGISILGVDGSMTGSEDIKAQAKTVTPKTEPQTITPDSGFNYLSMITVEKIPYVESSNEAGGMTVTIG